ncbi:MAG: hypothetical protein KGL39_00415 [Patescibacteria group bacterium]|nr:hypothetical protein [Patescibacteria group bacterium]
MDPVQNVGKILDDKAERDCIHIAILPVIADEEYLSPGCPLRLVDGYGLVRSAFDFESKNCIGVVDPFLGRYPCKGEHFYAFLKPGTVTGMRHHWTCPAVDNIPVPANESEEWLRKFASRWNFDYDEMIGQAQFDGGEIVATGIDLHGADELDSGDEELFWHHLQVVSGWKYDVEHRQGIRWTCSC